MRARFHGFLGNARVGMQLDVGFGDVVTPAPQRIIFPTILDYAAPRLAGTTPETAVAEKLEAMVLLDMANTRLKDFYDVWLLTMMRQFDGELLSSAIAATFRRRGTEIPASEPIAFSERFWGSQIKQTQWRAFLRKVHISDAPAELEIVALHVNGFALPVFKALAEERRFSQRWLGKGAWE